jgi:translocation and assembly module TamA
VGVGLEPTGHNGVDLLVTVDPGNRVSFVFEGDEIPSRLRRTITSAYRPAELGEELSLEEVQRETAQALRGLGYLEPQVAVDSAPADPADPAGARVIRVVVDGGRRVGLSNLVVEGLPDDDARRVVEVFGTKLSRVELVLESPAADVVLSRALQRRGYPQARIAERELSDDGETLVLRVDPGGRRQLVSIEIERLNENERARILESLELHVGDPVRSDLIGQEARTIERDLRDRGHADARVRARTRQVAEERPLDTALVYEIDPGPSYRIEEVRFKGLGASRETWVEGVAGLESGQTFRQSDVAEARARLYRTGVFQRIRVSSEKKEEDQDQAATAPALVTFELEEQRRWRLAYGGRWEDGRGISGVVDLLNTHSLGRGHLTGVRVIYGSHDQNLRLYHIIPRIVGEKSSLELLVEGKREDISSTLRLRSTEAWAQLTFPLTRRIANRPYIRFQDPELTSTDPDSDEPLDQRVISPLLGWQFAFDAQRRRAGEQRRRGIFIGIDLLGSHTALGSDVTSIGVVSQLKYFMPVGKLAGGRLTWAQFWRGGWTEAKEEPVPLVDRFRVGGEFSVRGYPTNSLGPLGPDGIPLGGELLFIVNQELHADLVRMERLGTISGLVFFDAGNVWLDRSTLDTGLFKSVGIGARYGSPFGPLRLDLAFPLDRRPDDPGSKLYFGFGSVF